MEEERKVKCIIRANRAGVFYGYVESRRGDEAVLTDVRRVWKWDGAASLSQLAVEGICAKRRSSGDNRFTVTVPRMTVLGVIEVIPCTREAMEVLDAMPVWRI